MFKGVQSGFDKCLNDLDNTVGQFKVWLLEVEWWKGRRPRWQEAEPWRSEQQSPRRRPEDGPGDPGGRRLKFRWKR